MEWPLERKLVAAFALALAILGAIAVASYRGVSQLNTEAAAMRSKLNVENHLAAFLSSITDAESAVRGFVVSGDPQFLAPYRDAPLRAAAELEELGRLIQDPGQRRRLQNLLPLATERLSQLHEIEDLRTSRGFAAAAEAVASERGLRIQDQIRRQVADLIQAQWRIVRAREQRAEAAARLAIAVQGFGVLTAMLIAGLATWSSLRSQRQRNEAEKALATGDALRQAIMDGAEYAIISGAGTGITLFNRGAERLLGYRADEVVGRQTAAIFHDPTEVSLRAEQLSREFGTPIEPGIEVFFARSRRGLPDEGEWTYIRKDGSRVPVQLSVTALRNRDGEIVSFLGIAHDISQRKQAQALLAEANASLAAARDRAESADRLKSAFLATMSHELRTPLNSIIGFAGILLQGLPGPLNAEQGKQLEMVRGSARHLLALINDLLDISKIEAGEMKVDRQRFDLALTIEHAVATVRPLAESKGLQLRAEPTAAIPVVGDAHRVGQILLNLLSNAIKFTEQGAVRLSTDSDDMTVRIRVADSGIGIRPEDLATLFQPFRQVDTGLARRYDGTGLGLAICRGLAELLGGRVEANSEWGKGSVFTLTLPLAG